MLSQPIISVATVVERGNAFLLVEETVKSRLVINQPAGRLEMGESLVAAAIREALEETGWEIEPLGVVGIYRWASMGAATGAVASSASGGKAGKGALVGAGVGAAAGLLGQMFGGSQDTETS